MESFIKVSAVFNGESFGETKLTIQNTGKYGEDSETMMLNDADLDKLITRLVSIRIQKMSCVKG